MKRLNIALMAGGDSSEREIALQSAAQIASALDPAKYDITLIDLHGRDWHYTSPDGRQWQVDKNDFSITIDGEHKAFDYALILIHGTPGENGRLQGYLDMMGIPYSSCSMTSSVVTFDKITTKRTVAEFGIPLARGFFFGRDSRIDPKEIVRTQPPDGAGLHSLPLPGRGARRFHRHARGQALPDRNQFDSRHERRQHRPQTGARSRHDARGTVRPDYRRHL